MTWVVMLFLLIAAAVAQSSVPSWVLLGQAKAPVLLSLTLYYALVRGPSFMLPAAVFAGFLQDSLSQIPLGYSAACFCAAGGLLTALRGLLQTDSLTTQVFFGGVVALTVTAALYLLMLAADILVLPWPWALLKTAGTAVLGMVCTPVVFRIAGRCDGLVGNVDESREVEGAHSGLRGSVR